MEVIGYSERGVINSLIFELKYTNSNVSLIDFLDLITFPLMDNNLNNFRLLKRSEIKEFKNYDNDNEILIEQSLSEFGDADLIFLIKHQCLCIFMEAKVKTEKKAWKIDDCFKQFQNYCIPINGKYPDKLTSNLFFQLFSKEKFIDSYDDDIKDNKFNIGNKQYRKIGNNNTVNKACGKIRKGKNTHELRNSFYVMLVPEDSTNMIKFFNSDFKKIEKIAQQDMKLSNWGFVTWKEVHDFCKIYNLENTLKVFSFNEGQIY